MTLGLNADNVTAICAVMTLVGGLAVSYLHLIDSNQHKEIGLLRTNQKAQWEKIDQLRDGKQELWTRAEQRDFESRVTQESKDLRTEIRTDLEALGQRLSTDISNLGVRFDSTVRALYQKDHRE